MRVGHSGTVRHLPTLGTKFGGRGDRSIPPEAENRGTLTDVPIKKARPAGKPYKMPDSGGLYVLASTTGNRSWRLKYRLGKKEKLLTFGSYPDVSLIRASAARGGEGHAGRRTRSRRGEEAGRGGADLRSGEHLRGMRPGMVRAKQTRWSPAHVPAFWKVCAHACLASVSVPSHAPFPPARRPSRSADPAFRPYAATHIRSGKGRLCSRLRR